MSIEILTASLAAGETKTFHVNGEYIELIDGQYPVDVLLQERSGGTVGVLRGAEVSFYSRTKVPFGQVQITSAQAQIVRFFIGDGEAGTRRISSTVQVVDGGRTRTIAGSAFMGVLGVTPGADQYAQAQLWNTAGPNNNRVIIKAYGVNVLSGPVIVSVGLVRVSLPAFNGGVPNKRGGVSPASVVQMRSDYGAALVAGANTDQFAFQGAGSQYRVLQEPIVLGVGDGFMIQATTKAIGINATFEITEESIL